MAAITKANADIINNSESDNFSKIDCQVTIKVIPVSNEKNTIFNIVLNIFD